MAAVLVLAVLATALLLWQRPWQSGSAADDGAVALPVGASTLLTAQLRALSDATTADAFVDAAGDLPAARSFGRRTWSALQAVASPGASFRYISGGEVSDRADGSATVAAEVQWTPSRASGLDQATTHRATVELRVAPQRDGTFSIIGASRRVGPVPMWLVGDITVDRADGRTVLRVDGGDAELPVDAMATRARAAVERAVPGVSGALTFVSTRTQAQMAQIVGQGAGAVAQIAAVTTGLDAESGSRDVSIVLNPVVFATMDSRAAQIVLSHEATHALTSAVGTTAADWVVEGFADYVALLDDTAPLSVSAGQVLAEVKAGRLPTRLPGDASFSATEHGLGAVYESAWMIFRLLAQDHSRGRIVAFYEHVIGGEPADRALVSDLGLTIDQLTADWRDYLTKSASTVS